MIPKGAILTYQGRWPAPRWTVWSVWSTADYVAQVGARLTGYGLVLRDANFETSVFGISSAGMDIKLTIQVTNPFGFSSLESILSLARHSVEQVSGGPPISQSIPYVQTPANRAPQPTGQPVPVNAPSGREAGGGISDFLSGVTQKGMFAIGLLGIGILAALFFLSKAGAMRT